MNVRGFPPYEGLTVYSGTGRISGANAFASYFGCQTSQFRGKRMWGDDLYFLTFSNKGHFGFTFKSGLHIRLSKSQAEALACS